MDENVPTLNFAPIEQFDKFYEVFEEIGNGQFAVVKRCVHRRSGVEYAAKFIRKRKCAGSRRGAKRADIEREVLVLKEISNHPNIISLYEVYESQLDVILLLELVTGGELFHYVYSKESLCEQETVVFVRQILHGLLHLHSSHVAHLDLKPENVMLQSKNSDQIKLIDFGLSRKILPGAKIKDMIGTPEFVAPEVVNYDCLSTATDIWAVGVITYILLSGLSPFMGETRDLTFCNITAVNYTLEEDQFACVSDLAKDFIRRAFVRDANRRPTCAELLRHPWLDDVNRSSSSVHPSILPYNNLEPVVHRSNSLSIRKRWKLSYRVVVICNYLMRNAKRNTIRRQAKENRKPKTVLLECTADGKTISATPVDLSPSKSFDDARARFAGSSSFRLFTFCPRPKSWMAAPTALVMVVGSVLGCLCLAIYSKNVEGYTCA